MEWLGDHVVSAGQERIHRPAAVAPARNQDDGRILQHRIVTDQAGQRYSATMIHPELGQHQVDRQPQHFGGGIFGIVAADDAVAGLAQPLCQHRQGAAIWLDDQ